MTLARGLDATFMMRPHFKVIAQALAEVERGDYDGLLVVTPPQVGTSTCVAEWFPFWWLARHPRDKVAVTSYSDALALRRGKAIRGYIEEYGHEYDLALKPGSSAAQDWDLTSGGGVRSVSVGSCLTGFPVNLLPMDDSQGPRRRRIAGEQAGRARPVLLDCVEEVAA
ncbi:hypothetical protein [Nonomuraea dietziae]|uniref:hypothetical protein n=1 Tax=Nonomuraea dietziae TaxID=65515 RepID=UPI0034356C41